MCDTQGYFPYDVIAGTSGLYGVAELKSVQCLYSWNQKLDERHVPGDDTLSVNPCHVFIQFISLRRSGVKAEFIVTGGRL